MPHHHHHHHHDHDKHAGEGEHPRRHGHEHHGHHGHRHGEGRGRGRHGFDHDGGMPRGRKLSSNDLQLLLLALVAEQPSHGYELIKALETRSNGFYVPSPGMMYPALAVMEDQGFVVIQLEGNRKRYALSDDGRAHLDANREHVDVMFAKLQAAAQKMELMRNALAEEEGRGPGRHAWSTEVNEARHALRRALHGRDGASAEEQQRIATILARAAAEIEGGQG